MTTPAGKPDPNWHWDGQKWLWWNGQAWVIAPQQAVAQPPATKRRGTTWLVVGSVLAVLLVVGAVGNALGGSKSSSNQGAVPTVASSRTAASSSPSTKPTQSQSSKPTPAPAPAPSIWRPKGYDLVAQGVAWKWIENPTCPQYTGCLQAYVITLEGCPNSLYAEVSLLDGTGTSLGFSNDLTGRLSPGQRAKLQFLVVDQGVKSAEFSKVSCY